MAGNTGGLFLFVKEYQTSKRKLPEDYTGNRGRPNLPPRSSLMHKITGSLRLTLQLLQKVLGKLLFHVLGLALHDPVAEHGQLADDRDIGLV